MECPAFFGDPQGVICTHDNATDDRLTLSIQNIQQNDSAIYRCSIIIRLHESQFITVNILKWDSLAPRIVEPSNSIIQVIYNHYKNTTPTLHRDAHQFLGGRYTCKAENEYGYDKQGFYVRVLGKSVQAINRMHVQMTTIIVIIRFYSYPWASKLLQRRWDQKWRGNHCSGDLWNHIINAALRAALSVEYTECEWRMGDDHKYFYSCSSLPCFRPISSQHLKRPGEYSA